MDRGPWTGSMDRGSAFSTNPHAVAYYTAISNQSCFARRSHTNFQPERISIAALFEALRQIPHERPKSEGERTGTPEITIRCHFFDLPLVHSCAKFVSQSTSVVHFHWSRLARDHFRILHYLLTYISMTKCLRRYRAVDTKKSSMYKFFTGLC